MKRVYGLIVMFCFYLTPDVANACKCLNDDPPEAFKKAKAIFIGRMLGGTETLSSYNETIGGGTRRISIEAGSVRFSVEEVFKGKIKNRVTVWVDSNKGTSCGPYGLRRGTRYLVYAYGDEDDKTGNLYINGGVCARTAMVESAKRDLDFLRNPPLPETGGNLRGGVWADLRTVGATPLPDLKVSIRGADGQVITVNTDKDGRFDVKKLKAGKYRVEPELPANYMSRPKFEEVSIDDGGTATVGFYAYIDGRVAGRLVDKEGRGLNWAFLHLEGEEKSTYGHARGGDGRFEAEGVPPGKYLLFLKMRTADYREKRFYYPGTFNREEAVVIDVGLGETVEGLQFTLPDGIEVRTLEGRVVWVGGKPAIDAQVLLFRCGSTGPNGFTVDVGLRQTETDEHGRFRLEGFANEVCWIEAMGFKNGRELVSPSMKIVLNDNLTNIKLVLSGAK